MATPVVNGKPAAETLASQYDIHDPVFEYQVLEPTPKPPASVAPPTTPAQTPPSTPEQPVAPSTPGVPPPAPSVSPQKHPTWLLQDATELGLHPLLIERLDTPELTQYVMSEIKKVRQNSSANQLAAAATSNGVQQAVTQPPPAIQPNSQVPPQAPSASAWDWGIHDDVDDMGRPVKRQITEDMIHPALSYHIKDQARRIKELEAKLDGFQAAAAATTGSQLQNAFDTAFNKIGGVFGSGTGASLKGKPEFDRRATVYAAVKGMYSSLPESVRNTMTIEQAVFSMAKSLFNVETPQVAAAATGNGQPTAEQFRTGGLQPPTQRRGPDQPLGVDFAKEQAANWWKENQASGGIPASGGTSLDEFFPV